MNEILDKVSGQPFPQKGDQATGAAFMRSVDGGAGNVFFAETFAALSGNATGHGAAQDIGVLPGAATPYAYFNAFYLADQAGTAVIEFSTDRGTTWKTGVTQALVANTPLILSMPVMFEFHRATITNGSVAQTAVTVGTSYTGG